jgi:hypothetical protein
MKNIFDTIDYKFFQVFSGDNRRIHAEIIMIVSDFFKHHNASYVEKEDLINHLSDYIVQRNFDKVLDDEGNDISKSTSREKALSKLNLFKRNGWLIEEKVENYVDIIQFDDNALIILKALDDISSNSAPKEYTGYIYVIDSLLRTFDYNQGVSLLERIYDNTEMLMNRLRGLNSSIKKYLTRLMNEDSEDAEKLLKTLLYDYQDNIINKAFSNLKLSDNPSKYKNQILTKLNELRSKDGMDKLIQNYKKTKTSDQSNQEVEEILLEQIDFVYNIIEMLQQTILMIDIKNAKYVKSSTSKLSFILSENFDVVGKIESILKLMKYQENDDFYNETFGLYKMGIIDPESIYKPRTYKEQVSVVELQEKREVDQAYVYEVAQRLFRDNRFSIKTINEYVKVLLNHATKVKSSDLVINNHEDLTRMILIRLYAHHEQMCYQTETIDSYVTKHGVEYKDFMIIKRGKQHAK